MSQEQRRQLMVEFIQSYRTTGQLVFKLLQAAVQQKQRYNSACLPILRVLKQRGSVSQSAIARELHHSDAAVSRQVGILAEEQLIRVKPDKNNRRVSIIELTEKGEELLQELELIVTDLLIETLMEMPDSQIRQLIDDNNALKKIITTKLGKEINV